MVEHNKIEVWPTTGIEDIPANLGDLTQRHMREVETRWSEIQGDESVKTSTQNFIEELKREWAIETGAVEGLYDIDQGVTVVLIEQGLSADQLAHSESTKDKDQAFDLINSQFNIIGGLFAYVKREQELSKSYIHQMHEILTEKQDTTLGINPQGQYVQVPLIKGAYKIHDNYPVRDGNKYFYCPPAQTESQIEALLEMHEVHTQRELPSEIQAAWLHHRFTQIHPYMDGNGRIARTLASIVFIRAGGFPLIVNRRHKAQYNRALEAADNGDLIPLVSMFARIQLALVTRASTAFARSLPDSNDPYDAALALRLLLETRPEIRQEKLSARMQLLMKHIHQRLAAILKPINAEIRKASTQIAINAEAPKFGVKAIPSQLRDELKLFSGDELSESSSICRIATRVFGSQPTGFVVALVNEGSLETSISMVGYLTFGSELISISPFDLILSDEIQGDEQNRLLNP